MRRDYIEPVFYEHQLLMDELNELCIDIKMNRNIDFQQLNILQAKINEILRRDNKPYRLKKQ